MTETKREKFERLSEARLGKSEFAIKQLYHLNSHNYEYEQQDLERIVTRLEEAVDEVRQQYGLPTPAALPPAPQTEGARLMSAGPLELTSAEDRFLISVGPQIGAALDAIEDQDPGKAKDYLLNLLRS